jgi:hypothetical protein
MHKCASSLPLVSKGSKCVTTGIANVIYAACAASMQPNLDEDPERMGVSEHPAEHPDFSGGKIPLTDWFGMT